MRQGKLKMHEVMNGNLTQVGTVSGFYRTGTMMAYVIGTIRAAGGQSDSF